MTDTQGYCACQGSSMGRKPAEQNVLLSYDMAPAASQQGKV